jgi:hypothetical protein
LRPRVSVGVAMAAPGQQIIKKNENATASIPIGRRGRR